MPSYIRSEERPNGRIDYIYSIAGEDPEEVAQSILVHSDSPFAYQGKLNGKRGTVPMENINRFLESGGEVAAAAEVNSTRVVVRFSPDELVLEPTDGIKATADLLVGETGNSYGGGFDIGDDFDVAFDEPSSEPYQDGGFVDPRSDSVPPQGLYNDGSDPQSQNDEVVGIGEWLITMILLCIPIVNIVFIVIWLLSKKTKKSKKNFIIVQAVLIVVAMLLSGVSMFLLKDRIVSFINRSGSPAQVQQYNQNASNANAYSNVNAMNSNANALSNSNANMLSNANAANANLNASNVNANSNTGTNTSNSNQVPAPTPTSGIDVSTTIDNLQIIEAVPGVKIAVITATMTNQGQSAISPHDALNIQGTQGMSQLNWVVDPANGYETTQISVPVAPNSSGRFQAAYYVDTTNTNPVHVTISNMKTGVLLAEQDVSVL